MNLTPLALIAALCVGGCVTVPASVQLSASQGLLVAEAGMDGANHAATVAASSGLLKGNAALKVKDSIDAGNNAVSAAHSLFAKGDIAGTIGQVNTALADVAAVQAASKSGAAQ